MTNMQGQPSPLEPQQTYSTWSENRSSAPVSKPADLNPSALKHDHADLAVKPQQLPSLRFLLQDPVTPALGFAEPKVVQPPTNSQYFTAPSSTIAQRGGFNIPPSDSWNDGSSTGPNTIAHVAARSVSAPDMRASTVQGPQAHAPVNYASSTFHARRDPNYGIPRPLSTASGFSGSSDVTTAYTSISPNQEFLEDGPAPIRRRTDTSSNGQSRVPRCIGQREVVGEGLCFVYDDGSYCRTVIDGEPVNPSWGITKAGKPRKRLAQACLTCREKKIKCEPAIPKCVQCTKSQRVCRG